MGYARFNRMVIGLVLLVIALFVGFNYRLNVYGLFGNVKGRTYAAFGSERSAKFLFSFNYIPANFDSLLVGTSISDNWDTSLLQAGRVYNCSINGGNVSEEALIAENVFRRRSVDTVLFVIYPYLTETFGKRSEEMNPDVYWSALGSVNLLRAYWSRLAIGWHRPDPSHTAYGEYRFVAPRGRPAAWAGTAERFHTEAQAVSDYQDLLRQARENGARVIGVIPIVSRATREPRRLAFERYNRQIEALFLPGETVIDLNQCPELAALQSDERNFQDGVHCTDAAAVQIVKALDRRLVATTRPGTSHD